MFFVYALLIAMGWGGLKMIDHGDYRGVVFLLAGCEFQAPQKCLRLIKVYAINFIP